MGERREADRLGRPVLSTPEALAQSLAIGPVVSAALVAHLIVAASGANAPLVMLIVLPGMLALGWTVSLYGRRIAGAGGLYEYFALHGRRAAVLGAGFYFLPTLVTFVVPLATSLLFQDFAIHHLGFDPGWWTGGVVCTVMVFALAWLGVRLSVRFVLGLTAVSAVPMLVLAIAVLADGGASGLTLSVFDPGTAAGGDLFAGLLIGAGILAGFEGAACVGEEARLPHREIPRAILLSVAIAGAFFLLMIYVGTIAFGPEQAAAEWGGDPVAFAGLGDRYVGEPLSILIALGILIDNVAVQLAATNIFSRGFFALGRDRLLPHVLARVSRHDTPVAGLVVSAASGLLVLFAAAAYDEHFKMFDLTVIAFALILMALYASLALGAIRFIVRGKRPLRGVVAALAGAAVPLLAFYGTFDPFPTGTRRTGLFMALGIVAAVLAWFAYVVRTRPDRVAATGRHALVEQE